MSGEVIIQTVNLCKNIIMNGLSCSDLYADPIMQKHASGIKINNHFRLL